MARRNWSRFIPENWEGVAPGDGWSLAARITLPLSLAPRMNELTHMHHWAQHAGRRDSYGYVAANVERYQSVDHSTFPRPLVVATRYSSVAPDEAGSDAIGGKWPIDGLVACGVLEGDSRSHITRADHWCWCPARKGSFVVEVWNREETVPHCVECDREGQ